MNTSSIAEKIAQLEKRLGEGVVSRRSDKKCPALSTGSVVIDAMTGIGGFPTVGITEVAGRFSSGKTTIALEAIRECQERPEKNVAVYVDFEHALDLRYAKKIGVNVKSPLNGGKFLLCQPNSLEEGTDICYTFVEDPNVGVIVVDSVASMIPSKRIVDPDNAEIGLQSRLLAPYFGLMAQKCNENQVPLIVLNQVRTKFEGTGRYMRASEDTPGGNALKFFALMRIWLTLKGHLKSKRTNPVTLEEEDVNTANKIEAETIKNKVAPPFRTVEFFIRYGHGVDNVHTIIQMALARGLIKQTHGGVYAIEDGKLDFKIRGMDAMRAHIDEHPEIIADLVEKIDLNNLWKEDE